MTILSLRYPSMAAFFDNTNIIGQQPSKAAHQSTPCLAGTYTSVTLARTMRRIQVLGHCLLGYYGSKERPSSVARLSILCLFVVTSAARSVGAFVDSRSRRAAIVDSNFINPRQRKGLALDALPVPPPLEPEENPDFDVNARSPFSGVSYRAVLSGIHRLYPPSDLDARNALSRTDGYWPYIQEGEDPPQQLTYGEFDFYFFAQLLDQACQYYYGPEPPPPSERRRLVFCDVGSGTGRLVLGAAALHPEFERCRGVELLPTIHGTALQKLEICRNDRGVEDGHELRLECDNEDDTTSSSSLPMAPVELICGSFADPYLYMGDVDIVFCFSACMGDGPLLKTLTENLGRQCRPGTIVITTEFMLPLTGAIGKVDNDERLPSGDFELELLEKIEGWCWLTGGDSTAFVHRITKSLWRPDQLPLSPPEKTLTDIALEAVRGVESTREKSYQKFKRGVSNDMVFHDFPEHWLPR